MTLPDTAQSITLAKQMIEKGDAEQLMPRSSFFLPITAYRFHALTAVGGDDDMFSSDFTPAEMRQKLGHVNCPTAVVYGTADEYVPSTVDLKALGQKIVGSFGSSASSSLHIIEGANHAISGDDSCIESFVSFVMKFLEKI
jgi:pimeloyl-ACP methyl ester carboxylesterase